jgi:hypothetical protein
VTFSNAYIKYRVNSSDGGLKNAINPSDLISAEYGLTYRIDMDMDLIMDLEDMLGIKGKITVMTLSISITTKEIQVINFYKDSRT